MNLGLRSVTNNVFKFKQLTKKSLIFKLETHELCIFLEGVDEEYSRMKYSSKMKVRTHPIKVIQDVYLNSKEKQNEFIKNKAVRHRSNLYPIFEYILHVYVNPHSHTSTL
jgi:hypothetical protein